MSRKPSRSGNSLGFLIIISLLLLLVLSSIAILAMYNTELSININTSFRGKELAITSAEAGANLVINNLFTVSPAKLSAVPDPSAADNTTFEPGRVKTHNIIGKCMVISGTCGATSTTGSPSTATMCCFRTGTLLADSTQTLADSSTIIKSSINKTPTGILSRLVDIPLVSDLQHIIYSFSITGGGPANSVSELEIWLETGPIPKRDASGTTYNARTGTNFN